MDRALTDLIRISNTTGKDFTLVQGGGGNTSVKTADGKYMYIKASGTALKDMNAKQGWRRLRLDAVLSVIEDKSPAKLDSGKREPIVVDRLLMACYDNVTSAAWLVYRRRAVHCPEQVLSEKDPPRVAV